MEILPYINPSQLDKIKINNNGEGIFSKYIWEFSIVDDSQLNVRGRHPIILVVQAA